MNIDKRYCQNRVQKRKKVIDDFPFKSKDCSIEEERQFKLSRFVKDVNKFVEEKENTSNKKDICKVVDSGTMQKTLKKMKPAKPLGKRGLFQHGIQTKFYTREAMGKEVTARLDESLQQIIGLANKDCEYQCSSHCKHPTGEPAFTISRPYVHQLHSRTFLSFPTREVSSSHQPLSNICIGTNTEKQETVLLSDLDSKLYSEFTRIVTIVCTESKYIQFRKKGYVIAVKRKLLDIYQQGKNESTQELSCPSEVQKSSVGTSPFGMLSPLTEQQLDTTPPHTSDSEHTFSRINFVPNPSKSTKQFLEETIGPGSCCSSELQNVYQQTLSPQLARPLKPLQSGVSQGPKYSNEPIHTNLSGVPPICNYTSMIFDGGGDRLYSNQQNCFLPPVEEVSPQFHYFPRKMF